jgi:glycosyltransferase involved in cell wall biosynthesis
MHNPRKKILYVITKSNFGGAQRYVFDLATHLPKDSFQVTVALGGTGEKDGRIGLLGERLTAAGVPIIPVRNFMRDVSFLRDIRALAELVQMMRRERPDVVHLNSTKAVMLGALAGRIARVPRIIATVHGWASNEKRPWWQRVCIRVLESVGMCLAHTTIVVADADATPGTVVIHNGIMPPPLLTRDEARHELGIPATAFVVGSIGELTRNKNYASLVRAAELIHRTHPTVTLALIGDGEERTNLEPLLLGAGFTAQSLIGFKADAASYLYAFDVFVLPSLKEGLPYVLLEAGYAGLPVIATSVGGVPEVIVHEQTGLLVRPENANELEHALTRYLEDDALRTRMGSALHAHVTETFSLERMIVTTTAQYEHLRSAK